MSDEQPITEEAPEAAWMRQLRRGLSLYEEAHKYSNWREKISQARQHFRAAARCDPPDAIQAILGYNVANCGLVEGHADSLNEAWSTAKLALIERLEELGVMPRDALMFLGRLSVYSSYSRHETPGSAAPASAPHGQNGEKPGSALIDVSDVQQRLATWVRRYPDDAEMILHARALARADNDPEAGTVATSDVVQDTAGVSDYHYEDRLTGLTFTRLPLLGWEEVRLTRPKRRPPREPRPAWFGPVVRRLISSASQALSSARARTSATMMASVLAVALFRLPYGDEYLALGIRPAVGPNWYAAILHSLLAGAVALWLSGLVRSLEKGDKPARAQIVGVIAAAVAGAIVALSGFTAWVVRPIDWLLSPLSAMRVQPVLAWILAAAFASAAGMWVSQARAHGRKLPLRAIIAAACMTVVLGAPRVVHLAAPQPLGERVFAAASQLAREGDLREATRRGEEAISLRSDASWEAAVSQWYLQLARAGRDAGESKWLDDVARARELILASERKAPDADETVAATKALRAFVAEIFNRGDSAQKNGRLQAAVELGESALALDPDSPAYKYVVSSWYLQLSSVQKAQRDPTAKESGTRALGLAKEAAEQAPRDDNAHAHYAAAALVNGDQATARREARTALSINPANKLARMVLERTGEI